MHYQPHWDRPPPPINHRDKAPAPVYWPISDLPTDDKRRLWAGIQKNNPALAEMMQHDPIVKEIRAKLGGEFVMTDNEIEELMK